jgi:hypothetical protein
VQRSYRAPELGVHCGERGAVTSLRSADEVLALALYDEPCRKEREPKDRNRRSGGQKNEAVKKMHALQT